MWLWPMFTFQALKGDNCAFLESAKDFVYIVFKNKMFQILNGENFLKVSLFVELEIVFSIMIHFSWWKKDTI